ncbi:Wobble nucleotide-excising tRNase [Lachnospiraceae bacterium XBB1006]|nr:Wobble nucleotide-excising tRNase [Lachnospiraceae bacterium XBB1006]
MQLDLSGETLFTDESLELDNSITYLFGKNGTGKSTITRVLKNQFREDFDVRVFQGFDSVVGSENKLGAVVLGEENTAIQQKIDEIQDQIKTLVSAKEDTEKKIHPPKEASNPNLWTKEHLANQALDDTKKKLEKLYTDSAKKIKSIKNPSVSISTYNKNHFQADIGKAAFISEDERAQCINTLKSETKKAPDVDFPSIVLDKIIDEVNLLLVEKIEEKIIVGRLEGNAEKQEFARKGLHIHKPGDVCAFCGNIISNEVFEELGSYFSADETKSYQERIAKCIVKLKAYKDGLGRVIIDADSFYPEYKEQVRELNEKYLKTVIQYGEIFEKLIELLEDKQKDIFNSHEKYSITEDKRPYKIKDFDYSYRELLSKNNSSDLEEAQKAATEKLRFDAVARALEEGNYERLQSDVKDQEDKCKGIEKEIEEIKKSITNIERDITNLRGQVVKLQAETKNEQKLALNINQKLRAMVNFELEHYEDYDHKGYYRIKDCETGESRPVTQLSTGEKNVIAFLYFIEKLNEIGGVSENKPQLIVFDDPMSSNDDTMTYLIVDQLQRVIDSVKRSDGKMVILTHNISFFMDVKRSYKDEFYQENTVLRLEKKAGKTATIRIHNKDEDVKSAYGNLWVELKSLYNAESISADTMLNTMRRIIECYTDFRGRNKYKFCEPVSGTMYLLNEGSHGGVELSPYSGSKLDALKMFCECFNANKDFSHVKYYWGGEIGELVGIL